MCLIILKQKTYISFSRMWPWWRAARVVRAMLATLEFVLLIIFFSCLRKEKGGHPEFQDYFGHRQEL